MQPSLIHLAAKSDLVSLKAEIDKLDNDILKSVPTNLSTLKSKVDKLDKVNLETTPVYLSELSNAVKNEVVKTTEYNAKIKNIEDKIPDITNLAIKTILNVVNIYISTSKRSNKDRFWW